jgi:hypothetical protein
LPDDTATSDVVVAELTLIDALDFCELLMQGSPLTRTR